MSIVCRVATATILALGLSLAGAAVTVLAAGSWWVSAPNPSREISSLASNQGLTTLAISKGIAGWYSPRSGSFTPIKSPSGAATEPGPALAVAASGSLGVIAYGDGRLAEVLDGEAPLHLPSVNGEVRDVALSGHDPSIVAVVTSLGLFSGPLGSRLKTVASGDGRAVIAPPKSGRAWIALVGGRLWESRGGRDWAPSPGAPNFGLETGAMAELSSGVVLVGQPGGLIWRGAGGIWSRAFQIVPFGGLGGVPTVTALVSDGSTSAYVATDGFGTLLTPDGGFTWYRAPPGDGATVALATVGPVFSSRAHGFVVALSSGRVFLHRLQLLPEPPSYAPTSETAELVGTAAVTLASVLLVVLLLWLVSRRQRRLSV
ncbi:MAG: hypothetical protein WA751_08640 [Candidatus Dormiibacterota bacterium]